MKMKRLAGIFLLLWMSLHVSVGEELMNGFIQDIISTFKLRSPTIIFDNDEVPQICYADQRVLCLMIKEKEQILGADNNETGMSRAAIST